MAAQDSDTKLDEALARLTRGASPDQVKRDLPETGDLVDVAHRLRLLATAPDPDLSAGRKKFLAHAAGLAGAASPSLPKKTVFRPAMAVIAAMLVLGIAAMMAARSGLAGWSGIVEPGAATNTATPTLMATPFTVTPTKTKMAPGGSVRLPPLKPGVTIQVPKAAPAPEPVRWPGAATRLATVKWLRHNV